MTINARSKLKYSKVIPYDFLKEITYEDFKKAAQYRRDTNFFEHLKFIWNKINEEKFKPIENDKEILAIEFDIYKDLNIVFLTDNLNITSVICYLNNKTKVNKFQMNFSEYLWQVIFGTRIDKHTVDYLNQSIENKAMFLTKILFALTTDKVFNPDTRYNKIATATLKELNKQLKE